MWVKNLYLLNSNEKIDIDNLTNSYAFTDWKFDTVEGKGCLTRGRGCVSESKVLADCRTADYKCVIIDGLRVLSPKTWAGTKRFCLFNLYRPVYDNGSIAVTDFYARFKKLSTIQRAQIENAMY
ncbi:MAG: hypothetical protein FWE37_00480 [Spirochaetaceae bacterium]|nr:hypothetical protein [Spirochaetaceae bacterium]